MSTATAKSPPPVTEDKKPEVVVEAPAQTWFIARRTTGSDDPWYAANPTSIQGNEQVAKDYCAAQIAANPNSDFGYFPTRDGILPQK